MNPEYGVFAHDLHVPIFEVKRVVTNSRLFLTAFGLLRNENDGSFDLCRDFSDHRILFLFLLTFFSLCNIFLLFFFLLV